MNLGKFSCAMVALMVAAAVSAAPPMDNERLIKYYRKKANVPPSQKVTVVGIRDAAIGGVKEGNLQIGEGAAAQTIPFTQSADGRYAIFAAVEDVTADPGKAVMQKISLKDEPS